MKRLALLLIAAVAVAPYAHAGDDGAPGDGNVSIKLDKDMELRAFLDAMSAATKRPVLYDPNSQRIRGQKLGVSLELKVPQSRLFDAFRSILSAFELTLIPVGPTGYEVYLAIDSRSTNNFVKNKAQFLSPDDVYENRDRDGLFVAAFFPLKNIKNMTTVRTALSTLVTPAGIGRIMEIQDVGVIVMDFAPTVWTMQQLLQKLDQPSPTTQVLESFELQHAKAKEVAEAVQELWVEIVAATPQRTRRGIRMPGPPPRIVPYAARNAVVVRASRAEMEMIRGLIKKIDQPTHKRSQIEVIRLQHIHAHILADTLTAMIAAPTVIDPKAQVIADPQSNSVIIAGDRMSIVAIKDIVASLDLAPLKHENK